MEENRTAKIVWEKGTDDSARTKRQPRCTWNSNIVRELQRRKNSIGHKRRKRQQTNEWRIFVTCIPMRQGVADK